MKKKNEDNSPVKQLSLGKLLLKSSAIAILIAGGLLIITFAFVKIFF